MIIIHEKLLHAVQHDIGNDGQWANELVAAIKERDPAMFGFLKDIERKLGGYGLTYALLIYKLLQSQHEVNELENDYNQSRDHGADS